MTAIEIDKQSIIDQVLRLSSFEARDAYDTSGSSLFDKVRIADADMPLIEDYLNIASDHFVEAMGDAIGNISQGLGINLIEFDIPNKRYQTRLMADVKRNVAEIISAHVMSLWLSSRLPDRVSFYTELRDSMTVFTKSKFYSKQAPTFPEE